MKNEFEQKQSRRHRSRWPALVLGIIVGVLAAVLGGVMLVPFALAHRTAVPGEENIGRAFVSWAATMHGAEARNPAPDDIAVLKRGQTLYGNCGGCHGTKGDGKGVISVFPPPSNLLGDGATSKSDSQLFWIIRNGIGYTAMPSYAQMFPDDKDIWALVSYLRVLQKDQALTFVAPVASAESNLLPAPQTTAFTITDQGLTPAVLRATSTAPVLLTLVNQGSKLHRVMVATDGKVPFQTNPLFPTQSARLQSSLGPGQYTLTLDADTAGGGQTATLLLE